jgi:hypothetical protein
MKAHVKGNGHRKKCKESVDQSSMANRASLAAVTSSAVGHKSTTQSNHAPVAYEQLVKAHPAYFGPFNSSPIYPPPPKTQPRPDADGQYACRFCDLLFDTIADLEYHFGSLDHLHLYFKIHDAFECGLITGYKSMNLSDNEVMRRLRHPKLSLHHADMPQLYINQDAKEYLAECQQFPANLGVVDTPQVQANYIQMLDEEIHGDSMHWIRVNTADDTGDTYCDHFRPGDHGGDPEYDDIDDYDNYDGDDNAEF